MDGPLGQALAGVLEDIAGTRRPTGPAGPTPAAVLVLLRPPDSAATTLATVPKASLARPTAPRASALQEILAETRVVLTVRRATLRRHAGEVAFPGGRWDPLDRSLYETALREAEEEIGLARDQARPLGALDVVFTFATNYAVHPFVAAIGSPPTTAAGAPEQRWRASLQEVEDVLELSLGELRSARGRSTLRRRGISFETDSYAAGGQLIWGATARILDDLLERLRAVS